MLDLKGLRVARCRAPETSVRNAAKALHELGAKIIAISDVERRHSRRKRHRSRSKLFATLGPKDSVPNYPQRPEITNEELLQLDCDVLIPAALGGVITEHNADGVKAQK